MEKKQIAQALMVGGVLVLSMAQQAAFAAAADACTNGAPSTVAGATDKFVQQGFMPKCSANVTVSANDVSTTLFTVKSMSTKGMHSFGGSSEGGAVAACENSSIAYAAPVAGTAGCS